MCRIRLCITRLLILPRSFSVLFFYRSGACTMCVNGRIGLQKPEAGKWERKREVHHTVATRVCRKITLRRPQPSQALKPDGRKLPLAKPGSTYKIRSPVPALSCAVRLLHCLPELPFACTHCANLGADAGRPGPRGVVLWSRGGCRERQMARCALTEAGLAAGEEPGCSVE